MYNPASYLDTMQTENINGAYEHPFSLLVTGASGTGKTCAVIEFLKHRQKYMTYPKDLKIYFFYKAFQASYRPLEHDPDVQFINEIPTLDALYELTKSNRPTCVIIDDYVYNITGDLMIQTSTTFRHRNCSVILLSQSLFIDKHAGLRIFSHNVNFIWCFSNSRIGSQMLHFAVQVSPLRHKRVMEAFYDAVTRGKGSFLECDFRITTPEGLRFRTSPLHFPQYVYVETHPSFSLSFLAQDAKTA